MYVGHTGYRSYTMYVGLTGYRSYKMYIGHTGVCVIFTWLGTNLLKMIVL